MIKNYLKLAWRNIWKSKATFGINVTGLAVAVCAALILSVTAYYQLTFNRFHKDLPSLYQVYHYENEVRGADAKSNLPVSFQDEVKNEFPEVVMSTRYMSTGGLYRFEGKSGSTGIRLVDPDFLNMFSFPILKGDKKPLDNSRQVAFSDKAAKALLGTDDVVGKTIAMKIGEEWDNFTISAIVKAAPDNSDLNFAVLMRFDAHPVYARNKGIWDNFNTEMFVKLVPKATAADFDKHSQSLVNKYYQDQLSRLKRDGAKPDADGYIMKFGVIPVEDMHFNGISASGGGSRKVTTYMLFIIAGFVLFIACINFINLSVARAFSRSKEMGMRKMMGAVRFQLIAQLWGEAVLICLIAGAAGLLLTSILMPEYNAWMHTSLTMSLVLKPAMLTGILLVFIIMTVVAGVYPALVMTRINAVQALKGSIKPGRKQYVRNSLIVVQFAFSALLICCTLVAWQQSVYLRSKPLGFNKEQVISLPLAGGDIKRGTLVELLRDNLAGQTGIMSVSAADNNLGIGKDGSSMTSQMTFDYNERQLGTHLMTIDYDYTKTLGIKLVAGRDFDRNLASDSGAIIINQELARQLGGDTILNKFIRFDSDWKPQQVIGITENFNFKSLNKKVEGLTMLLDPKRIDYAYAYIKVEPNDLPASMERVEKVWATLMPGAEFRGSFLDENVERQYQEEKRTSQLFMVGALLTIIISCMGLFAVAILAIAQRTKEIGIRKVLGSSIAGILLLLYRDFLKLVLLAIVIAMPLAWFFMGKWLDSFAYNVGLQWWVFVLAGLTAIAIAIGTVSIQSIRAALANPVKALRSE